MAKQKTLQKTVKPYEYKGRMRKKTALTSRGTRSWAVVRSRLAPRLWLTVGKAGLSIDEFYFEFRKKYGPRQSRWLTVNDIVNVAHGHGFTVDNWWITPTNISRRRKKHLYKPEGN